MSDVSMPTCPLAPVRSVDALLNLRAAPPTRTGDKAATEQAAKDFESIFLYRVLEEMKRTIPESGLLESGTSEQTWDIFWYYLAQDLADKGGIGLWKQLARQLEASAGPSPAAPCPVPERER